MILVLVGTQKFKFNRLFSYIDKIQNEEIIVQCGENDYQFNSNIKKFNYIPFEKLQTYIKKSDLIICHATPSCVFDALKNNKKVIAVPRMKKYKEHFNNHQVRFAEYLKDNNYCSVVQNEEEFFKELKIIKKKKYNKYKKKNNDYVKVINNDIKTLLKE